MRATFVELPVFERIRSDYLDDEGYQEFQSVLMANPRAGDVIKGAGGLRKIRFREPRRRQGQRGGVRVIYYWLEDNDQFLLFSIYRKGEVADLTYSQRQTLARMLERELEHRSKP